MTLRDLYAACTSGLT